MSGEAIKATDEPPQPEKRGGPGLKVIHASMMRMGTMSMSRAYRRLGLRTHHSLDDVAGQPYSDIERAAEACWPDVPGARSPPQPPYKRADWDRLWGTDYDVTTDLSAPFTLHLIRAYPEAKVVIVQRDFAPWWTSFQTVCLDGLWTGSLAPLRDWFVGQVLGIRACQAMYKVQMGSFGVSGREGFTETRAREVYEEFFEAVRREVPEERRLEYRVGNGWAPLCEFLGVEVPDAPFPRMNDVATQQKNIKQDQFHYFVTLPLLLATTLVAVPYAAYQLAAVAGLRVALPGW